MATFKGTGFRGYRVYLEETLDAAEYEKFVGTRLTPRLQEIFRLPKILPTMSYAIELQHEFLEICQRYWGADTPRHLRAMGHAVARTDLGGVYRILIKVMSPERTIESLTTVWNQYFSDGVARLTERGKGRAIAAIEDKTHHPLHQHIVAGYIEEALTKAGARNVKVVVRQTDNPHVIEFVGEWQ